MDDINPKKPKFSFKEPESNGPQAENPLGKHWLDDESEWSELKERVKRQSEEDIKKATREESRKKSRFAIPKVKDAEDVPDKMEVNINLSLPKVDLARVWNLRLKLSALIKKTVKRTKKISSRTLILSAAGAICVLIIVVGFSLFSGGKSKKEAAKSGEDSTASKKTELSHDPKFKLALPAGRNIEKDRIFYDEQKNFAKYDDQINGIKITVSEQPLPETFKSDIKSSVRKLAGDFSANESLAVSDTPAFIGKNINGQQTIIFSKKDLLIFILTDNEVEQASIEAYLEALQ